MFHPKAKALGFHTERLVKSYITENDIDLLVMGLTEEEAFASSLSVVLHSI